MKNKRVAAPDMKVRISLKNDPSFKDVKDAVDFCEIYSRRLFFVVLKQRKEPKSNAQVHYFNTDSILVYTNYYADFGPLNLGQLYKFCQILYNKLTAPNLKDKYIVYWTDMNFKKRANAAFLISSFAVIFLNMSPKNALSQILNTNNPYVPFKDANIADTPFTIDLMDCARAINKAFYFNLVDFSDFNLVEYEMFDPTTGRLQGDLNWIVPHKLLAFAGPCGIHNGDYPVEMYLKYFKANAVTAVIRLNKSKYDYRRFTNFGIDHFDLYFPDGTTPPESILMDFLEIVETIKGAVAIHCKAGLGRTGCLIGAYLMKHYRMSAFEAIAWMRIVRPGCVIGQQQTWLNRQQSKMWAEGNVYRLENYCCPEIVKQHKYGIYTISGANQIKPIRYENEAYFRVRDKIKKKRMNLSETMFSESQETQGDLLIAARTANALKIK